MLNWLIVNLLIGVLAEPHYALNVVRTWNRFFYFLQECVGYRRLRFEIIISLWELRTLNWTGILTFIRQSDKSGSYSRWLWRWLRRWQGISKKGPIKGFLLGFSLPISTSITAKTRLPGFKKRLPRKFNPRDKKFLPYSGLKLAPARPDIDMLSIFVIYITYSV